MPLKNTPISKKQRRTKSIKTNGMASQLQIAMVWLFFLLVPAGGYLIGEIYGFYAGLAILFFASPVTIPLLKEAGSFNPHLFAKAAKYTIKHPLFQLFAITTLNIIIFFTVVMNTLVNLYMVLAAFPGFILLAYLISEKTRSFCQGRKRVLFIYGSGPSFISLFFLLNFQISFNPVLETYGFSYHYNIYSYKHERYKQRSTMIVLDDNKYDTYQGIRCFFELGDMQTGLINYTISDGIFGFRVVKDYYFGYPQ
jgi:hypothetical protein